jgi:AraC-like DNA-binding protein
MDLHIVPGVTAREVAEAHVLDVKIQDAYCCKAMTYWLDEDKGCVFCLIEAPDKESVRAMHEKAHGLIPNEIIPVNTDVVRAFLGRIHDPEDSIRQPETMLKVFSDPAFRIILITKTMDTRLLQQELGKERMQELLLLYSTIIREQSRTHGGSEVYRREEGFVMSFASHGQAMECALAIRKKLQGTAVLIGLRTILHGGVPVDKNEEIFGAAIRFGQFLSTIGKSGQITMSSVVRNLFKNNDWNLNIGQDNIQCLTTGEENFLETLLETLTDNWCNAEFDVLDFCRVMSVSKSQLYRKCIAITGMSPNTFLREYRLLRSLELLKQEDRNIAQITFDAGFSSPSYFTKCFQKRFGMPPLAYLKTYA